MTALVERQPGAPYLSAQLWIANAGLGESYATHGYRHLLEHLMARTDPKWDERVEALGGVITATTERDGMSFRVRVPKEGLDLALDALQAILNGAPITEERVRQEARAVRHEAATREETAQRIGQAWEAAYGEAGLDPFGTPDLLGNALPAELTRLRRGLTRPERMALVVVGDVELDDATARVAKRFGTYDPGPAEPFRPTQGSGPKVEPPSGVLTARVGSFRELETAAAIAVGLAVASEWPDGFFHYVPLNGPSLVMAGRKSGGSVDLDQLDPAALYVRGKALARRWIARELDDPEETAAFRGRLLAQSPSLRPETLRENVDALTWSRFLASWRRFR